MYLNLVVINVTNSMVKVIFLGETGTYS